MVKLVGHLNVQEYNSWKGVFDSMKSVRKEFGSTGDQIFKAEGNDNEVMVLIEWDNKENAEKFRNSQQIKDALQRGGVKNIEFYYMQ